MRSILVIAWIFGAGALRAAGMPAQLEPCVSIKQDAERLACYDRAVAAIAAAEEALAMPINAAVTAARREGDGMFVLTLDNGQVWRQLDAGSTLIIESGDRVTVVRASLGSFRIADKRGRSAHFKRMQ